MLTLALVCMKPTCPLSMPNDHFALPSTLLWWTVQQHNTPQSHLRFARVRFVHRSLTFFALWFEQFVKIEFSSEENLSLYPLNHCRLAFGTWAKIDKIIALINLGVAIAFEEAINFTSSHQYSSTGTVSVRVRGSCAAVWVHGNTEKKNKTKNRKCRDCVFIIFFIFMRETL